MSEQFSLLGGDDAPPPSRPGARAAPKRQRQPTFAHTLFFALAPQPTEAAAIAATVRRLARDLDIGGQPLEAERLHVTLFPIGWYEVHFPTGLAEAAMRVADALVAPAFDVVFDRAMSFRNAGALVLAAGSDDDVAALNAFRLALGIGLADAGQHLTDKKATPHMTVSYRGREIPETVIEPVRWKARDFVLIDSHVGQHRHKVLGRWALQA